MYTRFKNKKTGIKLGINTIASTRKVVVPQAPPTGVITPAQSISISSSVSSSSSNQSLNKTSGDTSPMLSPTSVLSSVLSVSSVLIDDNNNDQITLNNNNLQNSNNENFKDKTLMSISLNNNTSSEKTLIPFKYDDSANLAKKQNSKSNSSKKENHLPDKNLNEEPIDPTCISYVKSMWEKYSNEIGKQNGPLRHVDENSQYPHLNGFVAFDMEHWWAERSISSMINEKSLSNSNENLSENKTKAENDFILSSALNKPISYKLTSNLSQTNKYQTIPSLHSLNTFQICFS